MKTHRPVSTAFALFLAYTIPLRGKKILRIVRSLTHLQLFLEHGLSPDHRTRGVSSTTIFGKVVLYRNVRYIHLLLQYNPDVNINRGYPLRQAVVSNSVEIVNVLIAAGADVNIKSHFGSLLELAIRHSHSCVVAKLLSAGAVVPTDWERLITPIVYDKLGKIITIRDHLKINK